MFVFTRLKAVPLLAAVAFTSAACGSVDSARDWSGEILDSSGITLVVNPDAPIWTEAETWTFQEALRIGSLDGDPAFQFGAVAAIDVDSRDRVFVLDQQAREVRVFSPAGDHVLTMGGPGSGPGELSQAASGVFVGPGDTILVPDLLNARVTRFTPEGEGLAGIPLQLNAGVPVRWELREDGHLLAQLRGLPIPGMEALEGGDPVVAFGTDGSVVDTAFTLPKGQTLSDGGGAPSIKLFEPEPVWDLGTGGAVFWAMNDEFKIHQFSLGGPVDLALTLPFERREVSETDQSVIRRAIRSLLQDQGVPPQGVEQVLQGIQFAERFPALANIIAGPRGTIWVQRNQTPEQMQSLAEQGEFDIQNLGARTWDVFDSDGRYLGPVDFPGRFVPVEQYGDAFIGIDRDELDVQSVVVLRVVSPGQS